MQERPEARTTSRYRFRGSTHRVTPVTEQTSFFTGLLYRSCSCGFKTDFFDGIEVRAERGGQAIDLMELMGKGEMGHMEHEGCMAAMLEGSEPVTLIFTVPAGKAGEWEIGCFADDGQHYDEGMKGKLIVES